MSCDFKSALIRWFLYRGLYTCSCNGFVEIIPVLFYSYRRLVFFMSAVVSIHIFIWNEATFTWMEWNERKWDWMVWNEKMGWNLYSKLGVIRENVFIPLLIPFQNIWTRNLSHMFWKKCSFHFFIMLPCNLHYRQFRLAYLIVIFSYFLLSPRNFFIIFYFILYLFIPSNWIQQ